MNLHYLQTEILKKISLASVVSFSDVQNKEITSNLFAYHIAKLVQEGLVQKVEDKYQLTTNGKQFVNTLEVQRENPIQTPQPKAAIKIFAFTGEDSDSPFIARTRYKEPFYGYTGLITTRVRYGERIEKTIEEEMKHRVGYTYKAIDYRGQLRIINKLDENPVEDKIFYIYNLYSCSGTFLNNFEDKKDFLITEQEFWANKKVYTGQREAWEIMKNGNSKLLELEFDIQNF